MRRFVTLMYAEWRAVRGLCVFLAVAAGIALVACDATWPERDTGRSWGGWPVLGVTTILSVVAAIAAVLAASTFASEHAGDVSHPLASVPTGARRVFCAKIAFVLLATIGIMTSAGAATLTMLAAWRGDVAVALMFADYTSSLPWIAAACVPALFVATCATLGMRGLTSLFAGAILPAALVFVATRVEFSAFGVVVRPQHVAWSCAFAGAVVLASAWTAFGDGFSRVSSLSRRVVVTCAVLVVPITGVATAAAIAMREHLSIEPGERGIRLELVSLSPNETFVLVQASRQRPSSPDAHWIVDLSSGHVVVLPGVEHFSLVPTGWNDDGTLSVAFLRPQYFSPTVVEGAAFDPRSGAVVRAESLERGMSPEDWRSRESPNQRRLVDRGDDVDVVDRDTGRVERTLRCEGDSGQGISFPFARRSDRFALRFGRCPTTVIDLADGSERLLEPDPNGHGFPLARVAFLRDGRTLFFDEHDALCLRELDGSLRVIVEGTRP